VVGFGSIGGGEILLLLLLLLVLFGPRRIPQFGRTIGKTLAEFRRATSDFKLNLEREIDMESVREVTDEVRSARQELTSVARKAIDPSVPPPPVTQPPPADPSDERTKDDREQPGSDQGATGNS
jgi:Tat protein translocase TatB subunit